jgi:predicted MFS family arabinose efflux permease
MAHLSLAFGWGGAFSALAVIAVLAASFAVMPIVHSEKRSGAAREPGATAEQRERAPEFLERLQEENERLRRGPN